MRREVIEGESRAAPFEKRDRKACLTLLKGLAARLYNGITVKVASDSKSILAGIKILHTDGDLFLLRRLHRGPAGCRHVASVRPGHPAPQDAPTERSSVRG